MSPKHFTLFQEKGMERKFTDADLDYLAEAMAKQTSHRCRYEVDPEAMEAAVRFHRHVDRLMAETGSAIRTTIIKAGVTGLIALLLLGLYSMLRDKLGI